MGNAQSGYPLLRNVGALDSFVSEIGSDIVYEKSLGQSRFLKTVRCRHRNGYLIVKIYIKPDPGVSLRKIQRRLKVDREALLDIPNVYSYQTFVETERAGYLIRQWVASSLYDRISTRPFLSSIERKWVAFQLLTALRDARAHKVAHGDVKSENILVTSWNWVYLSDFAPHKPTYLPLDDPSDFSFYFDTSGRRTCYIAPERFYDASSPPKDGKVEKDEDGKEDGKREARVTEAMDVFSAGCVMAELFREGTPLFTLSQLFKYREGELAVDGLLTTIDDAGVQELIKDMIALDPAARPTFEALLHRARGSVFPEVFYSFLHGYVASINELPARSPFTPPPPTSVGPTVSNLSSAPATPATPTKATTTSLPQALDPHANTALPSDADARMERIWADHESVESYLVEAAGEETVMDVRVEYAPAETLSKPFEDIFPVELNVPNRDSKLLRPVSSRRRAATEDGPALIILALVSSNVRNCIQPSSKLRALDTFLALAVHLTDEAKLDRMVPYIIELLRDDAASVRAAALRTLIQVLMLVTVITPSNASIFPEYIFPNIQGLVQDSEVSVRAIYAQCVVPLATTAVRFLEMGQALKAHGTFKLSEDTVEYDEAQLLEVSYDAALQDLQATIQEHLTALLVDSSSVVRRAVLHDISALCIFLGRQPTNDVLLSHMITYLNDRDWMLRYAFFDAIVDVAACAGGRSLEEYILPLMIQALSDVEETVVARVLAALTCLCELGLFQKMRIWELMSATLGFLYHPNVWIRQGAAAFISAAAKHLPTSDVWCILYPSLRHFLRSDIRQIDEMNLLTAMKPPISRQVFDAAVQWAMKAERTQFWRSHRRGNSKLESPQSSVATLKKAATSGATRGKSEEDEAQLARLRQLGMTSSDENKLMAMRDYILKLATATSSFTMRLRVEDEAEVIKTTADVELQKLKVVPQTVFLKTRSNVPETPSRTPSRAFSRRSTADGIRPLTLAETPRGSRAPSVDYGSTGAPFEDLRRRLSAFNGSGTSLPLSPVPRAPSVVSAQFSPRPPSAISTADLPPAFDLQPRPPSPPESVLSATNSTAQPRQLQRLQVGSTDTKAAPAVGSSRANATGLLEATARMRSEGSEPDLSGRTSPVSATGTIRGQRRPSVIPISTYDGQEPGVNNLLEHMYLDSNREYQNDFGPRVHEGPVRRRNAVRHSFASRDGTSRRPEATLIAHLNAHADAVNGIAVSPDHVFYVTASDDKTVKIWDTARLERNVTSKPRHTYTQHHARVKAVCMLEALHCFASAGEDGSVHVVRVHVTANSTLPKYGKLTTVREYRLERPGEHVTCLTHFATDTGSNLVYTTTHGSLGILDLRTMRVVLALDQPVHNGPVSALCLDRKRAWAVTGTASGVLTLWDIRFGLRLKSWKTAAAANGTSARVSQCAMHPTRGKGRWVIVAVEVGRCGVGMNEEGVPARLVEVWDIENSTLVETYETRTEPPAGSAEVPHEAVVTQDAEPSAAAAIAALVRARQQGTSSIARRPSAPTEVGAAGPSPSPDVRAMLVGGEFGGHGVNRGALGSDGARGFMITGSEDRRLRLWDLGRIERTSVLSGADGVDRPSYSSSDVGESGSTVFVETWAPAAQTSSQQNRPPQRMALLNGNQQNLLRPHQDTITAVACIDSPFRGGIISGDRSGVVKVWRVESSSDSSQ